MPLLAKKCAKEHYHQNFFKKPFIKRPTKLVSCRIPLILWLLFDRDVSGLDIFRWVTLALKHILYSPALMLSDKYQKRFNGQEMIIHYGDKECMNNP